MNFATLSGLYENARKVSRLLSTPNGTDEQIRQRLNFLAGDSKNAMIQRIELSQALDALDSHLRVLGLDEAVFQVKP